MLKAFYCCYSTDDWIDAPDARVIDGDSALAIAQRVLREPMDFIGFVDENGVTLQFFIEDSGLVWIEVPIPEDEGSYGKTVTLREANSVIESLPSAFGKDCLPGLDYEAW